MSDWMKRVRDWIKKQWPLIIVFAVIVATVIFLYWLVIIPLPVPPGY